MCSSISRNCNCLGSGRSVQCRRRRRRGRGCNANIGIAHRSARQVCVVQFDCYRSSGGFGDDGGRGGGSNTKTMTKTASRQQQRREAARKLPRSPSHSNGSRIYELGGAIVRPLCPSSRYLWPLDGLCFCPCCFFFFFLFVASSQPGRASAHAPRPSRKLSGCALAAAEGLGGAGQISAVGCGRNQRAQRSPFGAGRSSRLEEL